MAEYGIVMGIENGKIQGNCQLEGYKGHILVDSVQFGSAASRTSVGGGLKNTRTSVDQSAVTVTFQAGKWTAELMQSLYSMAVLSEVTLTQIAQAVDKTAAGAPTVVQKLTLTNAVVTMLSQSWLDIPGPRSAQLSFEFDKILYEIDTKPADFTLRNITEGAK